MRAGDRAGFNHGLDPQIPEYSRRYHPENTRSCLGKSQPDDAPLDA